MGDKNFLDIRYISKGEDERYKELIEIFGRKDFTFAGGRKENNCCIDTFILSEEGKTFLNNEQEEAVKKIFGRDLREIKCYNILNCKYYNTQ